MTVLDARLPFSLAPPIAEAKRWMRGRRRFLILALAVLLGGGTAGVAVALHPSSAVRPAAACRGWTHYYAYAVPQDPAHPPAAGSGATNWMWTPRRHAVKAGDKMRVRGHLWQVIEIAAMPGVKPVCRPFGIVGWPPVNVSGPQHQYGTTSMILGGRLVLRPAS